MSDDTLLSPGWAGTPVAGATSDASVLAALLEVEASWGETLAEAGLVPLSSARALRGIEPAAIDPASIAREAAGGGNPVIPLIGRLRRILKDDSALHRGATSQDVMDTALMIVAREAGSHAIADARLASRALAELAEAHRTTPCVARSLAQHALPSVFGLRVAGWLDGIGTATAELERAVTALPLQWGGAVGTQAALVDLAGPARAAALTGELAQRLGLRDPGRPWHVQRQPVLRLAAALAALTAALGKAAADVLLLQRPEIGELREPAAPGRGGSSAMPQKRNPVLSTLIRASALGAPGPLATLHQAAASAVDERPDGAWHAEWPALRELLRLSGGAAHRSAELFAGLQVDTARMRGNLELGGELLLSERISARLSGLIDGGKPALRELVLRAAHEGTGLRGLLRQAIPQAVLPSTELDALFDPAGYLGRSGEFIDAALAEHGFGPDAPGHDTRGPM